MQIVYHEKSASEHKRLISVLSSSPSSVRLASRLWENLLRNLRQLMIKRVSGFSFPITASPHAMNNKMITSNSENNCLSAFAMDYSWL